MVPGFLCQNALHFESFHPNICNHLLVKLTSIVTHLDIKPTNYWVFFYKNTLIIMLKICHYAFLTWYFSNCAFLGFYILMVTEFLCQNALHLAEYQAY